MVAVYLSLIDTIYCLYKQIFLHRPAALFENKSGMSIYVMNIHRNVSDNLFVR